MGISVNKTYIDRWINEQKRREKEGERDQFMREMGIEVSDRKTGTQMDRKF